MSSSRPACRSSSSHRRNIQRPSGWPWICASRSALSRAEGTGSSLSSCASPIAVYAAYTVDCNSSANSSSLLAKFE